MVKLSNDFKMPDDYKSDGCGSGWNTRLVPDTIYFMDISSACKIHDYAYDVGITESNKMKADREFLNNLLRLIEQNKKWYYPTRLARLRAYTYYSAVKKFGGASFYKK